MATRRAFLGAIAAMAAAPLRSWADAGAPAFLAAAKRDDGSYVLAGLDQAGVEVFALKLPGRGHAAAAHPFRPEAVAFARRPGIFALVIDCGHGKSVAQLEAPKGRHFYGHGIFSSDGDLLFTTENNFENGWGCIGVWQRSEGYRRVAEFGSGGVGPHEVKLMPDSNMLVVANGGIETHPDSGRAKLNIATMEPNLSYVDFSGEIAKTISLPQNLHRNSIRHIDVTPEGLVAFAMQHQSKPSDPVPLLGLHKMGEPVRLLSASREAQLEMGFYAGSVAFSGDGRQVAISSPRGGLAHVYDVASGQLLREISQTDVCGVAALDNGFALTDGQGRMASLGDEHRVIAHHADRAWDNHLVAL